MISSSDTSFQKYAPFGLIIIGSISRLIAHPDNMAPIAAMALFSGVYLNKKVSLFIPLIALFLSDLVIGFYGPTMFAVYGSFILVSLIGLVVKKNKNVMTVAGASVLASVIFYLITNFSVWLFGSMYPHTFSGLVSSYTMAIPFFRNTLIGDIFYVVLFFGVYELAAILQKSYANHQSHTWLHFFS